MTMAYEFGLGSITFTSLFICCLTTICSIIYFDLYLRWKKTSQSLVAQHILITGGSSGIGKEIGKLAIQRGANVSIIARNQKKLQETIQELFEIKINSQQKITSFKADVTDYSQIETTIQNCEEQIGPIDVLINCAGYAYPSKLEDIPLEHIHGMMNINYYGPLNTTRAILPFMKSRLRGKITFVSSIAGLTGLYGYTAYSGSKFALRGFAEALQMEVKPFGISITISYPPDTNTPCLEKENKVKPIETVKIGETAGVFEPDVVAKAILNDTLAEDFFSTVGIDGNVATIACAGMSPMSSVIGLVIQTLFQGPFRLVSLGYLFYFNRVVANVLKKKKKLKGEVKKVFKVS